MNKKAELTLLELLIDIVDTSSVYSKSKAELLQKLINQLSAPQQKGE